MGEKQQAMGNGQEANRPAWIRFGNWDGPVLDLPTASWRIFTKPRGSYYTHRVSAQAPCGEIVRALRDQYGIPAYDCHHNTADHNPLMDTIEFRNTKRGGIGGPDYELKRIDQVAV